MYEYLLKWGLGTLTKLGLDTNSHENAVLLEAIRAKNSLVVERFRIADQTCQTLIELAIRMEPDLSEFQDSFSSSENSRDAASYLGALEREFHPKYYREFRKLRARFDITNDLLSAYSLAFIGWINIKNVKEICTKKACRTPGDISRTYRLIWTFFSGTMTRLLRITSNDLRFWLTDRPYTEAALVWAREVDMPQLHRFFMEELHAPNIYFPSLEKAEGLEEFWKRLDGTTGQS